MALLVVFALPVALYAQETDPATVINAVNDAWNRDCIGLDPGEPV
jgi:hypothetical protein